MSFLATLATLGTVGWTEDHSPIEEREAINDRVPLRRVVGAAPHAREISTTLRTPCPSMQSVREY
jgi:hypothetical protein